MNAPEVLFLIPRSGGGGAQRVALLHARHLSVRYSVHLGVVLRENHTAVAELPERVTLHWLNQRRVLTAVWPLLRLVWSIRPAVVLSGMAHLNFLVLLLRPFFPPETHVLVRQNGTVSAALAVDPHAWRTRLLYRLLYPCADRILCQSLAMAEDLARELAIDSSRLSILPNPVEIDSVRSAEPATIAWCGAGPHLLAMGRLEAEKGFDLLLEAVRMLCERFPAIEVAIAGEGSLRGETERQAQRSGISMRVHLLGAVAQSAGLFSAADLFVLSSRHEGMPNALLEAAAAGLPLVATPACGGVVDLIRDKPGCWLADDCTAASLADALEQALAQLRPGERFAHAWIEGFRAEYSAAICADLIHALLQEVP